MTAHQFKIDPHEFDGRRILVTGGTKGIGKAVAARMPRIKIGKYLRFHKEDVLGWLDEYKL